MEEFAFLTLIFLSTKETSEDEILRKKRMCEHCFSIRKEISREVIGESDAKLSFFTLS